MNNIKNSLYYKLNFETTYGEYMKLYKNYKEKYGENIALFMRIGDFYEIYDYKLENLNMGNAEQISKIINCNITKKNSSKEHSISNPRMMGIPYYTLDKYISILSSVNYIVIIYEQKDIIDSEKKERYLDKIISPGTNLEITSIDNTYLCSIYIETIKSNNINLCGISFIDVGTGKNYVNSFHDNLNNKNYAFNQMKKIIFSINPKEIIIYNKNGYISKNIILKKLNINRYNCLIHYYESNDKFINNDLFKVQFQEEWFSKIFKKFASTKGMLSIFEYLNLDSINIEQQHSYMLLFYYIDQYYFKLLNNIEKPKINYHKNKLALENMAIRQLNILNFDNLNKQRNEITSLFDVINYTKTAIGYRLLKQRLSNPESLSELKIIKFRYKFANNLKKDLNYEKLTNILQYFPDFERLHRKLDINPIPKHIYDSYMGYKNFMKLYKTNIDFLDNYLNDNINKHKLIDLIKYCEFIFDIDKLKINNFDIENNIFNKNVSNKLNKLFEKKKIFDVFYEKVKIKLNDMIQKEINKNCNKKKSKQKNNIYVKIKISKKNIYWEITEHKYSYLSKIINKSIVVNNKLYKLSDFKYEKKGKFYKITYPTIDYEYLDDLNDKIKKLTIKIFKLIIKKMYDKFNKIQNDISKIIGEIDFAYSNAKCSHIQYYSCPIIDENINNIYFDAKNCRHPIVEKINIKEPFKKFNLKLNNDNLGIILYGLNAVGKSTLLKTIALIIVMAQSGLHVPCSEFKYVPFNKIMTRIEGNDNIFTSTSSFQKEMKELRNILELADNNSLVLIDELCRGTETNSSIGLTVATIEKLTNELKSKYILTTHLHEIYPFIKDLKKIAIKHMSVEEKNGILIYNRELKDGPSSSDYGIIVAKAMQIDPKLISRANKIKNSLIGKSTNLITFKKSNYNKKMLIKICNICQSNKNLHTHHIKFQNLANKDTGYFDDSMWHKNNIYNLINLCNDCHQKVHQGVYKIKLPIFSSMGYYTDIIKN